jgi:hypothetical protein
MSAIPASTGSPLNENTTGTDFSAKGAARDAGPPITIRATLERIPVMFEHSRHGERIFCILAG